MTEKFIRCSLLPLLAGVLLLGSCVNDDTLEGTGQYRVEPDIPVTLPLKVMLSGNKIATRAAQSDEAERTINNIYVIAFKPEKIKTVRRTGMPQMTSGS